MKTYYNTETGEVIIRNNIFQARRYFKADGKKWHYKGQVKRLKDVAPSVVEELSCYSIQDSRKQIYQSANCYIKHQLDNCLF